VRYLGSQVELMVSMFYRIGNFCNLRCVNFLVQEKNVLIVAILLANGKFPYLKIARV